LVGYTTSYQNAGVDHTGLGRRYGILFSRAANGYGNGNNAFPYTPTSASFTQTTVDYVQDVSGFAGQVFTYFSTDLLAYKIYDDLLLEPLTTFALETCSKHAEHSFHLRC